MQSTGLQPIEVLAAMITPAVLISATALLLLSTVNRLGRLNDRIQGLRDEVERFQTCAITTAADGHKHELVLDQLTSLCRRLLLLRTAVTGMYVSIALLVTTSIAAGMCVIFPRLFSLIPTSVGLLAVIAFLYSTVLLVREARIAVQVTHREIDFFLKPLARTKARRQLRTGQIYKTGTPR